MNFFDNHNAKSTDKFRNLVFRNFTHEVFKKYLIMFTIFFPIAYIAIDYFRNNERYTNLVSVAVRYILMLVITCLICLMSYYFEKKRSDS